MRFRLYSSRHEAIVLEADDPKGLFLEVVGEMNMIADTPTRLEFWGETEVPGSFDEEYGPTPGPCAWFDFCWMTDHRHLPVDAVSVEAIIATEWQYVAPLCHREEPIHADN